MNAHGGAKKSTGPKSRALSILLDRFPGRIAVLLERCARSHQASRARGIVADHTRLIGAELALASRADRHRRALNRVANGRGVAVASPSKGVAALRARC